ncbi:hypothetical protein MTO96_033396 [Rhipicephalus appendiculatus]
MATRMYVFEETLVECNVKESTISAGITRKGDRNKGAAEADKLKRRIVKASRMPQLPEEHKKIIVRPRVGLNLNKVSTTAFGEAIVEAVGLTAHQAKGDIVCPDFIRNIVVV